MIDTPSPRPAFVSVSNCRFLLPSTRCSSIDRLSELRPEAIL